MVAIGTPLMENAAVKASESISMRHSYSATLIFLAGTVLSGCSTPAAKVAETTAPAQSNRVTGYLAQEAIPDSSKLSPPPPAANSAAQALDDEISRGYLAMSGSPRWKQAAQDAVLVLPEAAETFSCALNATITKGETPMLYSILQRTIIDASRATDGAKSKYMRARPFMVNHLPTCTPARDDVLRKNASYPSGHASVGWTWALILAELAPDRANDILARGRAFAQSRIVCNVHWHSDTAEGITLASAAVAKLHAEPAFVADMSAARQELVAVRAKGTPVTRDCKAEAEALSQ